MTDYAIRAERLSKRYRVTRGRRRIVLREAIQEAITSGWEALPWNAGADAKNSGSSQTFWALQNVSFKIQRGESVGVIGSNGAGKSTLLKILARVTAPTIGKVFLRGRVGSLLEVGTGFHPELSGRENVYLNGAVLGMQRREIDRKFDEIVAFSEVEDFLETPVKFYSSGMRMRLAFSVAAHLEPEILLIDEILAVGDAAFQKKSLGKMDDVVHDGRTVLFVSHNMAAVKALCSKGIYIEKGRIKYFGELDKAVDMYLNTGDLQSRTHIELAPDLRMNVQFLELGIEEQNGTSLRLPHDQPFTIRLKVAVREANQRLVLNLSVLDADMNNILQSSDFDTDEERREYRQPGVYTYRITIPPILAPGNYRLSADALLHFNPKWNVTKDSLQHVCPFEIYDNGSPRSRAGMPWMGKLAYLLDWYLEQRLDLPEQGDD
jgi:lipopolysaccharide transport system ATP-binding protein